MKILHSSILLLLGVLVLSCTDKPFTPAIEEPNIIIPIQNAQFLFSDYEENRVGLIEATQNIDDNGDSIPPEDPRYIRATRALTVDYSTLKQYLAFIEQKADSAHIEIQGLRIYLAKYPNDGNLPNGSIATHPGAETVFFNPVMEYGEPNMLNDDISFAIKTVNGQSFAIPIGEILEKKGNLKYKNSVNNRNEDDGTIQSLAGNHFERRPPPPPPDDPDYE